MLKADSRSPPARLRTPTALRLLTLLVPLVSACAHTPDGSSRPTEHFEFWRDLRRLCGRAYEGRVVEAPAGDTTFAGKRLVMHVRECASDSIRIPFHVGEDRSRTWVLRRGSSSLSLHHDHRHADGHPDSITWYGGEARAPGTRTRQEFPADAGTAALIPRAATNVWTVEVVRGRQFVYALRREGTDRRFRIEFDLTRAVATPPSPWGAR